MSEFAKLVGGWYRSGFWKKEWVKNMVEKGRLTPDEYRIITDETYQN